MKKLFSGLFACGMALSFTSTAQTNPQKCAIDAIIQSKIANDPVTAAKYEAYIAEQRAMSLPASAQKTTASVTIPVVFHVVLTQAQITEIGGTAGIFNRIGSQLNALNRDFNAKNPDQKDIPAVFKGLFANAEINFALAHRDPSGKATSGVEIKTTTVTSFDETDGEERRTSTGGINPWDEGRYLNIWVANLTSNGVLGYAYHPYLASLLNTPSGATLDYLAFGQKATGVKTINGIDSGRTLVHELGHFFTLNHIWGNTAVGSGDCNDDDDIGDTPKQKDANYGCPSVGTIIANCTNSTGGEMYMNYMDYVNDKCMLMFTKGQVAKIRQQLTTISKGLTEHPELTLWPTDIADVEKGNAISLFPNPTSGSFTISVPAGSLQGITVVNAMGQSVKNIAATQATSYNFDLNGMAKGVYMVHCRFEEGTITRKLVLQ